MRCVRVHQDQYDVIAAFSFYVKFGLFMRPVCVWSSSQLFWFTDEKAAILLQVLKV